MASIYHELASKLQAELTEAGITVEIHVGDLGKLAGPSSLPKIVVVPGSITYGPIDGASKAEVDGEYLTYRYSKKSQVALILRDPSPDSAERIERCHQLADAVAVALNYVLGESAVANLSVDPTADTWTASSYQLQMSIEVAEKVLYKILPLLTPSQANTSMGIVDPATGNIVSPYNLIITA